MGLHGWLERNGPTVFVLTDGASARDTTCLAATARLLAQCRAQAGDVFGRFSGPALARAIRDRDVTPLAAVVHDLVDGLTQQPVRYLVTVAADGRDAAEDLCRTLAGVAVQRTRALHGRAVPLYEFVPGGDRSACVAGECRDSTRWRLAGDALVRKLAAAALAGRGRADADADALECLHHVAPRGACRSALDAALWGIAEAA